MSDVCERKNRCSIKHTAYPKLETVDFIRDVCVRVGIIVDIICQNFRWPFEDTWIVASTVIAVARIVFYQCA